MGAAVSQNKHSVNNTVTPSHNTLIIKLISAQTNCLLLCVVPRVGSCTSVALRKQGRVPGAWLAEIAFQGVALGLDSGETSLPGLAESSRWRIRWFAWCSGVRAGSEDSDRDVAYSWLDSGETLLPPGSALIEFSGGESGWFDVVQRSSGWL